MALDDFLQNVNDIDDVTIAVTDADGNVQWWLGKLKKKAFGRAGSFVGKKVGGKAGALAGRAAGFMAGNAIAGPMGGMAGQFAGAKLGKVAGEKGGAWLGRKAGNYLAEKKNFDGDEQFLQSS